MPTIANDTVLEKVDHIIASGTGVLDFSVTNEESYFTWWGSEEADWEITDVDRIENIEEDRVILYPEGDFFICEIKADSEEENSGPVRCFCE